MIIAAEDYVEHHGVKGMKWGQRRAQKHAARAAARQKKFNAQQAKATSLVKDASKHPDDLFLVNGQTVATGKEFVDHMLGGGLMNPRTTRVYARKTPAGYKLAPRS